MRRLSLVVYDLILLLIVDILILGVYPSREVGIPFADMVIHCLISVFCIFVSRCVARVYNQVWRYGDTAAYIRLLIADTVAFVGFFLLNTVLPMEKIEFIRIFSIVAFNLLLTLTIRLLYHYLYEYINMHPDSAGVVGKLFSLVARVPVGESVPKASESDKNRRIRIAVVGAGSVGVMLVREMMMNPRFAYIPCCFIDIDRAKVGRQIAGIPILSSEEATVEKLASLSIQEIVFALPKSTPELKKALYDHYKQTGCKLKVYDFPTMQTAGGGKRHLREFDIEELLFREPVAFERGMTDAYYKDKVVLITGGGGSIGSELCRQIAKMQPKRLIILDICENGAYDIQQELRIAYGGALDLQVEIVSICDREGMEQVFLRHRPDIIVHAAAHKHVPLMEHNCVEAVKNNVFGTLNVVNLCEKFNVSRFMMVSTDKAVNPTNVMGATKRMCEMIVLAHSRSGSSVVYSATRFGNVLGSAGSVIPLFKRQIMNGGPITLTDKRIIRYFMTIPEASQLVLKSGAMAKNGELFVLDMGKPVRILELAENMIRLSGYEPYEDIGIIETGLRPGEKLYEELLIRTEELRKTDDSMIFIEKDAPLTPAQIEEKMTILREAVATNDDNAVRDALKRTVPTYFSPEEVNRTAADTEEMKEAFGGKVQVGV
ncbi:MAG: NAD-dependent epimerase/dehydratase family protein [Ruminococcaceae bacterium]|nr:NAD-dependent epimerase/dehydratase family protein [Oscillospiraceae bacterium]